MQYYDLKDVDIKYLCNFFLDKMTMLKYLVVNLEGNDIADYVGIEIGKSISKMIELDYLELNLANNELGNESESEIGNGLSNLINLIYLELNLANN